MLKKLMWSLSLTALLIFNSCGSGSSKEGKELMQKVLNFVGIPHDIVAGLCIDKDRNGICSISEVKAKVTINQGDTFDDIWAKLALNEEGQYFLEVYDETLPILVQIQDEANVDYPDGKFTLNFDGFKTKENNEEKEISILQSMVDNNALTTNEADKFRTLTNPESQKKFYTTLLSDLETNLNTLKVKGLDNITATTATIKEMGDETKVNQEQADKINACANDQTCVDNEIKNISDELIITDDEATDIKRTLEEKEPNEGINNNLNKGLVAHYQFEGNAKDSSGNGNDGEAKNGVTFSTGVINKSALFSDTKEIRIDVPDSDSLDTHDSFSLSLWINPSDRRRSRLIEKYYSSEEWAGGEYALTVSEEGHIILGIANYDSTKITDSMETNQNEIPLNQWSYITASFNKGKIQLYINGNLTKEKTSSIKQITTKEYSHDEIHIGNIVYNTYNDGWFVGKMDDLRIYNRALNEAEIKELYKMGKF